MAINWDSCCPQAEPVRASTIEGSSCFLPWTTPAPPGCARKNCDLLVPCAGPHIVSHYAERDPWGGCRWKSECEGHQDCASAVDLRFCCSGFGIYPADLVAQDACLTPGTDFEPGQTCADRCLAHPDCPSWPPGHPPEASYDWGPRPYCWSDSNNSDLKVCGPGPV